MEDVEILIKTGLTEKEAKIYLLALDLEKVTSGDIIKKLNVYSKTAYELLNKLVEKGFLSYYIKDYIKHYSPCKPEKILNIVKEKQEKLEQTKKEIEHLLPLLKKREKNSKSQQEVTIYEGAKSIKFIFEDALKQKNEILVFGGGGKFKEAFPEYSELWHKQRIKNKIKLKLLYDSSLSSKTNNYNLCEIKFLSKEFHNPAPTMIYANTIVITLWTEKPLAFVIESEEVSKTYRSYFNLLWNIAKK